MDHGTVSFFKAGEDPMANKSVVVDMGPAYHNLRRKGDRHGTKALYVNMQIYRGDVVCLEIWLCEYVNM